MKYLDLAVFEPGDMIGTLSKGGKVALWTVLPDGSLAPSDNRLFASGLSAEDPLDMLDLSVRSFNVLKREGLNSIGDLLDFYDKVGGPDGLDKIRNMGQCSRDEIVSHIRRLRGEPEPPSVPPSVVRRDSF